MILYIDQFQLILSFHGACNILMPRRQGQVGSWPNQNHIFAFIILELAFRLFQIKSKKFLKK